MAHADTRVKHIDTCSHAGRTSESIDAVACIPCVDAIQAPWGSILESTRYLSGSELCHIAIDIVLQRRVIGSDSTANIAA